MRVFRIPIRQGIAFITARTRKLADKQAESLERDAARYWVREQTEIRPGVFALGAQAKAEQGIEQWPDC
jgi:hypothetical protein